MRRSVIIPVLLFVTFTATAESHPGASGGLTSAALTEGRSGQPVADIRTVIAPDSVAPGSLLRLATIGRPVVSLVELRLGERLIVSAQRIGVRMTGAAEIGVFLMGIDSTVDPGTYTLRGLTADDEIGFAREVEIVERVFRTEEIALDRRLTSLRRDPDPAKTAESRELTELIFSRDPSALYHAGPFAWPLPEDSRQTSLYGDRRVFVYSDGTRARTVHMGLDLAGAPGTDVLSSGRGIVRMARSRIVTGNTVVIEHLPGVFSMYYHLDEISVVEGAVVDQGEQIGTLGATGLATGPHLHWEIRVGGVAISPVETTEHPLVADLVPPGARDPVEEDGGDSR